MLRPGGKLPDRTIAFLDRLKSAKIDMGDTLLWWIALGYDSPRMIAEAMRNVGTEPEQVVSYLNKLKEFPGVYGDISFTPDQHNGYPDDEVVMVEANSLKDGAFNLLPVTALEPMVEMDRLVWGGDRLHLRTDRRHL